MVIEYFLKWIETAPAAKRAESALALVKAYQRSDVSLSEREDIEAALTVLLDDRSSAVRVALATAFGAKQNVPRHMVSALANDILEVAIIILSRSPLFHDSELIEFMKSGAVDAQIAIACRPWLSSHLLDSICSYACEEACMGAFANPVADFSADNLHALSERFGETAYIRNLLLDRSDIAAETRLLLVGKLSSQLSTFVTGNSWISVERANKAVEEANEKAAINFSAVVSDDDVARIARSLINNGKMNVAFLLRAICMGNITLVAHVISELSGVKFSRVEAILTKDRRSAFKAVYARAGLPKSAFEIFACAISTWRRLLSSGSKINQERMPFLVTREILEMYSGQNDEIIDELMVLLRRLSAEAARESAKSKAIEIAQRAPEATNEIASMISASSNDTSVEEKAVLEINFDALALEVEDEVAFEVTMPDAAVSAQTDQQQWVLQDQTEAEEFDALEYMRVEADSVIELQAVYAEGLNISSAKAA